MEKHIIWSNANLNIDDWRDDLLAEDPDLSEDELYERMYSLNSSYLDEERGNLRGVVLKGPILLIADLGLWNGHHPNSKRIQSGKVSDCLYTREDGDITWYVDEKGEFRATIGHHDGVNSYRYRGVYPGVSEEQLDRLQYDIASGKDVGSRISRLTYRLGDLIGDVYGWQFSRRPKITKAKI